MNLEEARSLILDFLGKKGGRAKTSEMIEILGGEKDLYERVREDMIFNDFAEPKGNVGLILIAPDTISELDSGVTTLRGQGGHSPAPADIPTNSESETESPAEKPKIFLSYGRRDAADLADRLTIDLEARGYDVWRDTREIRTGSDFMGEIEDGLRQTRIVVALLSPRSVRRNGSRDSPDEQDSVCLDELSFARFSQPPKRIILPVMARTCEPPFVIYRLNYVDLTRWNDSEDHYRVGLDSLVHEIAVAAADPDKLPRYNDWEDELRPWDFSPFLEPKRQGFIGREWLFKEIDLWRLRRDERALLITGDPGIGKSAIVAELVHQNPGGQVIAYHCCQADRTETLRPDRFIRSIAAMIASRLPDYAIQLDYPAVQDALSEDRCETDPVSAFEEGVLIPLRKLPAPEEGVRYLLIDALDECLSATESGGRSGSILNVLAGNADRLPPWVRILATTRKDNTVLNRLAGLRAYQLDATDPRNLHDIDDYILKRLQSPALTEKLVEAKTDPSTLATALRDKGDGNFLYVVEVLRGIERGDFDFARMEALPRGLSGLYVRFFDRLFQHDRATKFTLFRRLFQVVVAAQEPLTIVQLAAATGIDSEEDLPRWLRLLSPYLPPREGAQPNQPTYAIYHKSLADWLARPDHEYHVSVRKGHELLADFCLDAYRHGVETMPAYARRQIVCHLLETDSALKMLVGEQALSGPLSDLHFIRSRCSHDEGYDLVIEYHRALAITDLSPDAPGSLLRHYANFFLSHRHHLIAHPTSTLSIARNFAVSGPVVMSAEHLLPECERAWWRLHPRPQRNSVRPAISQVLQAHQDWISGIDVRPSEYQVLSSSGDRKVKLWNLRNGRCLATLMGHERSVECVSFSPDGQSAASADWAGKLMLWSLKSFERIREIDAHENVVTSIAHLSDNRIVTCSWDGSLRLWSAVTGDLIDQVAITEGTVNCLAVLPETGAIVAGLSTGELKQWYGADQITEGDSVLKLDSSIESLGVSPSLIAAGCQNGSIVVANVSLQGVHEISPAHTGRVTSLAFSQEGLLCSAGQDGRIRTWCRDNWKPLAMFEADSGGVNAIKIIGVNLISGGSDKLLRAWDLDVQANSVSADRHEGRVNSVALFPDGRAGISGGVDSTVRLWNTITGDCTRTFSQHKTPVQCVAVSPDGQNIYSGSRDGNIYAQDADSGEIRWFAEGHAARAGGVRSIDVSPSGKWLVSVSKDKRLCIRKADTGVLTDTLEEIVGSAWTVRFISGSESEVVVGCLDGTVRVIDIIDRQLRLTMDARGGEIYTVATAERSANAPFILSGGIEGMISLWDLCRGHKICTLNLPGVKIRGLGALSRPGAFAIGGSDETIRHWDQSSGDWGPTHVTPSPVSCLTTVSGSNQCMYGMENGVAHFLDLVDRSDYSRT